MNNYDLIVLGGGPGGYIAAIRAAKRGKKTLLIEADALGGTCLNRGCIPTKAFLHAGKLYHDAGHSEKFGVTAGDARFDFARMALQKDAVVKRLNLGVASLLKAAGVTVLNARGELTGRTEVAAGGESYTAPNIILATGSAPSLPPIPGADLDGVMTSDGALTLKTAPKSVVIVGGGVIGMEFASFFLMLEIPVTVDERFFTRIAFITLPALFSNSSLLLLTLLFNLLRRACSFSTAPLFNLVRRRCSTPTTYSAISRYIWPWMRMVNPVGIFITAGTTADCKLGESLIEGIDAIALLADRGYDVNAIFEQERSMGMEIAIPPKKNRKEQRNYDKDLYKLRYLIENTFLMLNQWR